MTQRIIAGALFALLAAQVAYAQSVMKCDQDQPTPTLGKVYEFNKWYGGCDKNGMRDGDGIELYEDNMNHNRIAVRRIYFNGHAGQNKFEEYTWFTKQGYANRRDQVQGYGLLKKDLDKDVPAWAKFILGPVGRSPTAEESQAVDKFLKSTTPWTK